MELLSKNYFGVTGFLFHMNHCLPEKKAAPIIEGQPLIEPSLLERVKKEAPIRIASAVGAYYALPIFAWLGGCFQFSLAAYSGWMNLAVPRAREHRSSEEAWQECFEHLIRGTYNFAIYFFRKSSSFTFLFPYEAILWMHKKVEGELICPQDQSEELIEDPNILIKKCARFLTGQMLGNLRPEDDLKAQLKETFMSKITPYWEGTQNLYVGVRAAAARRLSGAAPVPDRTQDQAPS